MGQLVEVALEIDVTLKEQAEKVFAETVRLGKLPFELDEDLKQYIAEQPDTPASDSAGSVRA